MLTQRSRFACEFIYARAFHVRVHVFVLMHTARARRHIHTRTQLQAVKGYVRFITMWKIKLTLKKEEQAKANRGRVHFSASPKFEYHHLISNEDRQVQCSSLLKYMFAGDFGFVLEAACSQVQCDFAEDSG